MNGQMVKQEGRRCLTMKKDKLNYRIHDPNSVEDTAKYLLKIYIEANREKVDRIIRENLDTVNSEAESIERYSA